MSLDAASTIAVAGAVVLAALIVVIVVAASAGACGGRPPGRRPVGGGGAGAAAVHDVERALGDATLVTYEQARRAAGKSGGSASPDDEEEEAPRCALCLSEFASSSKAGELELVRVVAACGHFFHAGCGVDGWLRARGTCPLCRAEVWATTLPRPPLPECPPLPARSGGATVGSRY